jgi:hypothetical protein
VVKFVVRSTDRGLAIYRNDNFVSTHPIRRQALITLTQLRADLKAQGLRSLIRLEHRMKPKSD